MSWSMMVRIVGSIRRRRSNRVHPPWPAMLVLPVRPRIALRMGTATCCRTVLAAVCAQRGRHTGSQEFES